MAYIPRLSEKKVRRFCSIFPVVGVTGPRQSGKFSMLKNVEASKGKRDIGYLVYRGETLKYSNDVKVLHYKEFLA